MNTGAFGEGFPYSNFHDLNMDWIIKIAKDFLDQYTHIQETIQTGLDNIDTATSEGLSALEEKKTELEGLLQEWYDTHSSDIANQLRDCIDSLVSISNTIETQLNAKGAEVLASIPDDYTALGLMARRTFNEQNAEEVKTAIDTGARVPAGNILATSDLSGTQTSGSAWRTTGTPTSGSQYAYKRYNNQSGNVGKFIYVTGNSWGEEYPLVTFYDSTDHIVALYGVWGNTAHDGELVTIPVGTSYFYINGRSDHAPNAKLITLNSSYMFGNIVRPFTETINTEFVTAHSDYDDVRDFPNNYIYAMGSSAYTVVDNLPADFTTNGCLVKFNPNISPYSKGYTTYILMNETSEWFGFDTSTRIQWHRTTQPTGDTIPFGFAYLEGTFVEGKAIHINGSEGSNSAYIYATFNVTGGNTYLIDGWQFASSYPAYIIYDSSDNVIGQSSFANATGHRNIIVTLPSSAVKVAVNGYRTTATDYYMPAVKYYDSNLSDYRTNIINKRYLIIGDSYAQGYNHDGGNDGWAQYLVDGMGLSSDEYEKALEGGTGFTTSTTFTDVLRATRYASDYFTDIVVAGGFNDWDETGSDIKTGISNFMDAVKLCYPNAKVHIGFIANIKQGSGTGALQNWETIKTSLFNTVLPAYQSAPSYGGTYMNLVEYALTASGLSTSDGYHPSETGNRSIANAIANALLTGSAPLPYISN